jgi:hypothetical protein
MLPLALALTQALALAGAPCALPERRPEAAPFASGELLTYDLELVLVKAGKLSLRVDRPMTGAILPLKARAQTTAAVANLRRMTAVALSWIGASTLMPERYHEEGDEDGVRRSTDVRLAAVGATVTLDQRWRDRRGPKTFERKGEVLDALSALYYLRAARLAPGERFCFDMIGAGRYWRVAGAQAAGHETIETPAGRFETFRVDAEAVRADLAPGAKGRTRQLHVWLTTDARRLPVSIVGEVDVGPVSATLSAFR